MRLFMLGLGLIFAAFQALDASGQIGDRDEATLRDVCQFENKNDKETEVLKSLIKKLSYLEEEFCSSHRIQDIFSEYRWIYNNETKLNHSHLIYVLYYSEYACEYRYDLTQDVWAPNRPCYNTF